MFAFSQLEPRRTGIVTEDQPSLPDYLESSAEQGLHDSLFSTIYRMEEYHIASGGSVLDPDSATKKYGLPGLKFTSPINEERAQLLHDRHRAQLDRDYFLNEGHHSLLQSVAGFTTSMASSMLNPLDFSTAFIPITRVGGEAANILGRGALRRTLNEGFISLPQSFAKKELSVAAINNAIFQTGAEGVRWGEVLQTHDKNYTLGDSLLNIAGGTLIGTGLHAGVKYASKLWSRLTPETKEILARRAMDNFVKGEDSTDLHKYANLDENVIRDQLILEMTRGMEESTGKLTGEAKRIRDSVMSQYETGPKSVDEWVEIARKESKEAGYSSRADEYGDAIKHPEELKSVLGAAEAMDEAHKNLVNTSLPGVSQQDVVIIARDFIERIAQLRNPTDAQVTKSRLIQAILRNPTETSAMNLSALLDLRFNPKESEFPTKYSHISDREIPEGFSLPPQQDRHIEEMSRDIEGRQEFDSAAHFLREVHQRATGTGFSESRVREGTYEPLFTQQGDLKQIIREGRAQELLNSPEILGLIKQEKSARIKALVNEELAKRIAEQNATNRRGPESDRSPQSRELEKEGHVDNSQIKSWSPPDNAQGSEAMTQVIEGDINSLKADVGLTKAQVAEETAKIEGGIRIKVGKLNPEEGAIHVPLPKGKLSALAPELVKSKEFGFAAGKRVLGTELMNRLRNLIAPGEFSAYEDAGLREFLSEPRTTKDLSEWLQSHAPSVNVQKLMTRELTETEKKAQSEFAQLGHTFVDKLPDQYRILLRDRASNRIEGPAEIKRDLISAGFSGERLTKGVRYLELAKLLDDQRERRIRVESPANWQEISPKREGDMPGYVELAVTIPHITEEELMAQGKTPNEAQKLHRKTVKFSSSHRFPPNTVGWARGYVDKLPSGERVFHVVEIQSDWTKEMRDIRIPEDVPMGLVYEAMMKANKERSDPLLQHYERLALKAAIDHARSEGISKVAISDAETAMMTEGHDRINTWRIRDPRRVDADVPVEGWPLRQQAEEHLRTNPSFYSREAQVVEQRPTQEKGMRLHYDTTYWTLRNTKGELVRDAVWKTRAEAVANAKEGQTPVEKPGKLNQIAQELTGAKPEKVSFGEHMMAVEKGQFEGTDQFTGQVKPRKDLIFRNPSGEPKTDITAHMYDISKAREGFSLFGSDKPVEARPSEVKNPDKLIQQAIDCATKKLL